MTKTSKKTVSAKPQGLAMHSAASPEWGTPPLLRSFAATVLRPAAMGARAIDLDYSSSEYWNQWWEENDRPHAFLDGSKGRNVLIDADRHNACPRIGSGFENPPGIGGGDMVQACWTVFEKDHREHKMRSGCWIGFSVEQFGSLQNVAERNPLTCDAEDLITTIVPSRRAHYVVHPQDLVAIVKKKQARRDKTSKQWAAEQRLLQRLRAREDDRPVDAGAPSHLSYVTLLWNRDRAVRNTQMKAASTFLKEQQANSKSLLYKFEAIGPLELKAR